MFDLFLLLTHVDKTTKKCIQKRFYIIFFGRKKFIDF